MIGRGLSAAAAGVALLCAGAPASAYAPGTDWQTVVSPRFRIHYAAGRYAAALDVARAAEHALDQLTVRLGWTPDTPIPIVLADETDWANGFAQSAPYSLVGMNAVVAEELSELAELNDWHLGLVGHELAHIVHIDTIHGLPRVINTLFGRLLIPNGQQPAWIVEGLATYFESVLTTAGRARSPLFDMMLRMAVLADEPATLGTMSGFGWHWPQGTTRYLWGSWFTQFIVDRHGEDALRRMSHDYGGRLIPFAVNATARAAVGEDYRTMYDAFLVELRHRYRAQRGRVLSLGRREGTALTARGQEVGPARVAPDGRIYFVESPIGAHTMLKVREVDGTEREVAWAQGGAQLALVPGGRRAVLAQAEVYRAYYFFNDLFLVDLESGRSERLTHGARAHSPDVSPDGARLVFVQNDGPHAVLRQAPLDRLEAAETLADLGPTTQVYAPRYAPDGAEVVFVGQAGGQRDLYRLTLASGELVKLTDDLAIDGGPSFTPDGAWVVFHSDRDGIYNLYAVPRAGGELRRLSRVLGGAFQPEVTADGAAIIYRSYGHRGYDLARLALPAGWQEEVVEPLVDRRLPLAPRARLEAYPSETYRPWSTLRPRAWLPLLSADTRGELLGISLSGFDAVGDHAFALSAWVGLFSQFPGFSLSYRNNQIFPGVGVDLTRSLGFAAVPYLRNGEALGLEEELWTGRVGAVWPLLRRRDHSLSLATSYSMVLRRPLATPRFAPDDRAPLLPDQGRFADLAVTLGFSNVRGYLSSISAEEGVRADLSLRVEDPYLGSEYSSTRVTANVAAYLENPWFARQVLALSLSGGIGQSSYRQRRLFAISGLPRSDLLLDLLNLRLGTAPALRGFPLVPFVGDVLVNGHAEYRFPFWDIESGIETLPIFFRSAHGAVFFDAAAIADAPGELWAGRHASVGAELRLDLIAGEGLPATLRLGYGRGLGADRVQAIFLVLGNTF